jgi:hypothetical protein
MKKYIMEGVPRGRDIKKFAAKIEETLNRVHDSGYNAQIIEQPNGVIINGTLDEHRAGGMSTGTLLDILSALRGAPPSEDRSPFSERSKELTSRFMAEIEPNTSQARLPKAVEMAAPLATRGFSSEELKTASEECEKFAAEHEKEHTDPTECSIPLLMRSISQVARTVIQTQLS